MPLAADDQMGSRLGLSRMEHAAALTSLGSHRYFMRLARRRTAAMPS
ncbi:hypothetical protein SAMN06272737_1523 [Blastococcus mobilis]|uniref:Uncharacterized protein n=1 Tax=Blastococcus mobilis TaxID=1938746 RepID=A0A239ANZ6_9ACTN|nr:hypothetical protein SAMN06272737_1523 [Blastococcus mobilis]